MIVALFFWSVLGVQAATLPEGAAQPQTPAPLIIDVVGACPTATDVWGQLHALAVSPQSLRGRVRVVPAPEGLSIELSSADEPNRRRVVASPSHCESRARTVALVIAAWLADVPRQSGSQATAELVPPRARESTSAMARKSQPAHLGAALIGAIDRFGPSAGARLDLRVRPWARGPTLAFAAGTTMAREVGLGQGRVSWRRPMLMVSPGMRLVEGTVALDADAGPVFGALRVAGKGYDVNRTTWSASLGGQGGIRFLPRALLERLWLDCRVLAWLGPGIMRNELQPTGGGPDLMLPRWELQLSLGVSWAIAS